MTKPVQTLIATFVRTECTRQLYVEGYPTPRYHYVCGHSNDDTRHAPDRVCSIRCPWHEANWNIRDQVGNEVNHAT